ncbi:MAG TPA: hypothetical protein VGP72_04530 [Planctomycetota bacterium]|jgi:hypothetical protein
MPLDGETSLLKKRWAPALLLSLGGAALLLGCWWAPFTAYDDPAHIGAAMDAKTWRELVTPQSGTWFPLTLLSYQIDHAIFARVLGMENWAIGVRLMSCVYHVLAAILLWRVILKLGPLTPNSSPAGTEAGATGRGEPERTGGALFIALAFVVHPMACETVCWASERKNTLAALFGFLSLLVWLKYEGRRWRAPLSALLFFIACVGKPSALGLIPVFCALELLSLPYGAAGQEPRAKSHERRALRVLAELSLLIAVAVAVVWVNVHSHSNELVTPPGGSAFTALLTDLEILSRYLLNLFIPLWLSAVYFVDPVTSIADPRVIGYGALLAFIVGGTLYLAQNRRRALFAWLWFFGALGPNLNLIALAHFMQDRYVYLSTPAFFMVLVEVAAGLRERFSRLPEKTWTLVPAGFVLVLASLGIIRSAVFQNAYTIFSDAVRKQPQSSYARFGLGSAYAEKAYDFRRVGNHTAGLECWKRAIAEWKYAVDQSPDALRFADYSVMALQIADWCKTQGDAAGVEHYLNLAAFPPNGVEVRANARAAALGWLSAIRLEQKRPEEAYKLADAAANAEQNYDWLLARAKAGLALASAKLDAGSPEEARALIAQIRKDVLILKEAAVLGTEVQRLLSDPKLSQPRPEP